MKCSTRYRHALPLLLGGREGSAECAGRAGDYEEGVAIPLCGGRAPSPATTSMAILTTAHCYVGESGEESSPATGVSWRIGGRGRSSGQDVMKLTVRNLIRPNRGELRRKKKLTPETLQKQGGTSSQGGARTPPEHIPARSRCTGGSLPRQG